jgi:hypothetical protein
MNPAVISELLAGAKCFQCLTPRQRNRLNAYLLSRQSPGPGPGPDPEPPIDPSACAVEDVTDGGGDTFDCYNEGVFTTLPSYAGTGLMADGCRERRGGPMIPSMTIPME